MKFRFVVAFLFCSFIASLPEPASARAPLVLAAASLQEALSDAADAWAAKGHERPVVSFAGTPALARQIEAGAPADLFVSADSEWMDYVAGKGLVQRRSVAVLASNRLVLVAPAQSRLRLTVAQGFPLARALGSGRLALADPEAVPAGRYARTALVNLGVWNGVARRIAAAENVRAALALVERGAAPLGVVYATDARASRRVRIAGWLPAASHPPIRYFVAGLRRSANPNGEAFRRFLLSRQGRALLAARGFTVT